MSKSLLLLILSFCFSTFSAVASTLPPSSSGKIYVSETTGNWVYLPKTDKSGNKNLVCLALATAPPYAVTLRGISGEFGLTMTNKDWALSPRLSKSLFIKGKDFQFKKDLYPIDSWTLGAKLSQQEEALILKAFSQEKEIHFALDKKEKFRLPLKGSARILSLLTNCLKENNFP